MNVQKYLGCLLFTLGSAALLTGCEIDAGIDAGPGVVVVDDASGSLSLDIAVEGREDRFVCDDFGVDAARVRLLDGFGDVVDVTEFACEDFGGTFDDLPEDVYSVEVTLLDFEGRAMSPTKIVDGLEVIDDTDLEVSLDFPVTY